MSTTLNKERYEEIEKRTSEYTQLLKKKISEYINLKYAAGTMLSDGVIDLDTMEKIKNYYIKESRKLRKYIDLLNDNVIYVGFELGVLTEEPDAFGDTFDEKPVFSDEDKKILKEAEKYAHDLWKSWLLDGTI